MNAQLGMSMNAERILQRSAERRRELLDNLSAMTNGKPSAEQMLLLELMCCLDVEMTTIAARFSELCDFMVARGSEAPAGDGTPAPDATADPVPARDLLALCGGELRCTTCHAHRPVQDPAELQRWIDDGFPRCCGMQMLWVTKREIAEEQCR